MTNDWDGRHPPPPLTPWERKQAGEPWNNPELLALRDATRAEQTEPEVCGCDESKALRARLARLEGQISGMREALPFRDAAMREAGARSHVVRRGA